MSNDVKPTVEMNELMDVLTGRMSQVYSEIVKGLFSEEAGTQVGKAVGALYKELVAAGIEKPDALGMARDYLETMKTVLTSSIHQPMVKKIVNSPLPNEQMPFHKKDYAFYVDKDIKKDFK